MSDQLTRELHIITSETSCNPAVRRLYVDRIEQGGFTRDEDEITHFCVYFLPLNPHTGQIYMIHHKKSGLWISPGGHLDKGESPQQALSRELREELGYTPKTLPPKPFLLTITEIDNPPQTCRAHYDIWYLIQTDGTTFKPDLIEFHEARWMTISKARQIVIDPNNRKMLDCVQEILNSTT